MKISKLFHWLYAILMFLPILVFIPNAFYYGFNKDAVAQEKTEQVPVYYLSNNVSTKDDLIVGRIYYWTDNVDYQPPMANFSLKLDPNYYMEQTGIQNVSEVILYPSTANNVTSYYIRYTTSGYNYSVVNNRPFNFILIGINNLNNITQDFVNHITISNVVRPTGEYQPVTTNMSITDSMSYAWKSVWQNDLFSWTNDTFLKEPFVYITDLFSIPSSNVLINALSYWLDISIIWLVFDVIMYVPLLTHRWLDKGIVE